MNVSRQQSQYVGNDDQLDESPSMVSLSQHHFEKSTMPERDFRFPPKTFTSNANVFCHDWTRYLDNNTAMRRSSPSLSRSVFEGEQLIAEEQKSYNHQRYREEHQTAISNSCHENIMNLLSSRNPSSFEEAKEYLEGNSSVEHQFFENSLGHVSNENAVRNCIAS